jgi:hypothetical protein
VELIFPLITFISALVLKGDNRINTFLRISFEGNYIRFDLYIISVLVISVIVFSISKTSGSLYSAVSSSLKCSLLMSDSLFKTLRSIKHSLNITAPNFSDYFFCGKLLPLFKILTRIFNHFLHSRILFKLFDFFFTY